MCVCACVCVCVSPCLSCLPLRSPPPGGGALSLHCFARQYLLQWFVFPICHTHILALLSHYFESITCVYSVMFSLQRRCTGCRVPFSDPSCCFPVTMYGGDGTTHAHLMHMCWPLLWGLYQMGQFCHIGYISPGGVTQVDHESAQLSRLEAVVVASPKPPALPDLTPMALQPQKPAVCLHQWRVPQSALKYPCNAPPPQGGRPSRAMGGDFKVCVCVCVCVCLVACTAPSIGCTVTLRMTAP